MLPKERTTYETLVSMDAQILAQQAIQAYLSKIITQGKSTTTDNLEHLFLASRHTTTELIALRKQAYSAHTTPTNSTSNPTHRTAQMSKEPKPTPSVEPRPVNPHRDAKRLKRLIAVQRGLEQYLNVVHLHERQMIEDLINDLTPEIARLSLARPDTPKP